MHLWTCPLISYFTNTYFWLQSVNIKSSACIVAAFSCTPPTSTSSYGWHFRVVLLSKTWYKIGSFLFIRIAFHLLPWPGRFTIGYSLGFYYYSSKIGCINQQFHFNSNSITWWGFMKIAESFGKSDSILTHIHRLMSSFCQGFFSPNFATQEVLGFYWAITLLPLEL